jgi:DNA-binding IscR family transcriptional regulator
MEVEAAIHTVLDSITLADLTKQAKSHGSDYQI